MVADKPAKSGHAAGPAATHGEPDRSQAERPSRGDRANPARGTRRPRPGHAKRPNSPLDRILAGFGGNPGRVVRLGRCHARPPILDQVHVWQTTISVTETAKGPDGIDTLKTVERLSEITLADLGLAALILATTLIAAKNIPGLLEMSVLQHLPLEAGIRYAVATVSRYVITVVGLMLACNTIGLGWAKVQWLLAAISVGLGFGLQEIFANFVSGLIILFERPVRVGDVVTIADVTGTVSQIHMRPRPSSTGTARN